MWAMCGSDGEIRDLEEIDKVYVYDNDSQQEIVKNALDESLNGEERSSSGPSNIKEKDLNDMVLRLDTKSQNW